MLWLTAGDRRQVAASLRLLSETRALLKRVNGGFDGPMIAGWK